MTHNRECFFPRLFSACFVAVLFLCLAAGAAAQVIPDAPPRIVAIGDVHGDYDALVAMLQSTRLVDGKLKWSGGNAVLVQVGDFLDRGPKDRMVMDLFMRLEKEAPRKGGRVVVLLGNHEAMNMVGDLRYVSAAAYAGFADGDSGKRREKAYSQYVGYLRDFARSHELPEPALDPAAKGEWMRAHPLGYVEHRQALDPQAKYGAWLRTHSAMAKVGTILFLHGGISPALESGSVEAVNKRLEKELRAFDVLCQYLIERNVILPFFDLDEMVEAVNTDLKAKQDEVARKQAEAAAKAEAFRPDKDTQTHIQYLTSFLTISGSYMLSPESPLWYRGFALWSDEEGPQHLAAILPSYGVERVVVGHTVQKGQILSRFDGKVFLIDTGMLTSYFRGGRPSALEIRGQNFTAIYPNERVALLGDAAAQPAGNPSNEPEAGGEEFPGGPLSVARGQNKPESAGGGPARVWLDVDGKPLPFKTDEEVMEFLRTAKVKDKRNTSRGITRPYKVLLEKDGLRVHAAFRTVNEQKDMVRLRGGRVEMFFRDSYIFECAAYALAGLLGLDNVPPVVERRIGGQSGSLQIWVEQSMTEMDRLKQKIAPQEALRWNRQIQTMRVFDHLIFNTDRNQGNIVIDQDWKLWMIDHTRAFRRSEELENPENIRQCDRKLFERLQTLDPAETHRRLDKYLYGVEIDALLKRRARIVEVIRQRVAEQGESQVLYDPNR
jgi:hypothetical protein